MMFILDTFVTTIRLFILFSISYFSIFYYSYSIIYWTLNYSYFIIHWLSCGYVYYDANKINAGRIKSCGSKYSRIVLWAPFLWAILVLAIPIIPFALYLLNRRKIFEANHQGFHIEYLE
jgi:hypothetical protein